ncbi:MAG: polysaccharide deacetylase family protein [Bdellovibrio sp.]|nr:polysaccharide deacetylase family protein [Bdellovibrio sp.]
MKFLLILSLILTLSLTSFAQINIEQRVQDVIASNETINNVEQWESSGNTPADLFSELRNQITTPELTQELCQTLSQLEADKLALFEHEIQREINTPFLPCKKEFLDRIKNYFDRTTQNYQQVFQQTLPKRWAQNINEGRGKSLESDESLPIPPTLTETPKLKSAVKYLSAENPGESWIVNAGLSQFEFAFTFDDGPNPERTPEMVKLFQDAGIKATFFEIGNSANSNPDVTKLVSEAGFPVGSHTMSHPDLRKLSYEKATAEIQDAHDLITNIIGLDIPFFRFPYGASTPALKNFVEKENKWVNFFWSIDTLDWKLRDPATLLTYVKNEINSKKKGVILFHDIHRQTLAVMPDVLKELYSLNATVVALLPKSWEPTPQ